GGASPCGSIEPSGSLSTEPVTERSGAVTCTWSCSRPSGPSGATHDNTCEPSRPTANIGVAPCPVAADATCAGVNGSSGRLAAEPPQPINASSAAFSASTLPSILDSPIDRPRHSRRIGVLQERGVARQLRVPAVGQVGHPHEQLGIVGDVGVGVQVHQFVAIVPPDVARILCVT